MAEKPAEYEGQSDEKREEVLKRAQSGRMTATGQAKLQKEGKLEAPEGEDAGSPIEIAGGMPTPTIEGGDEPRGLQAEEATYATNGTVPSGMVASPAGPVPVSGLTAQAPAAERLMQQERERTTQEAQDRQGSYEELTDEQIASLRPAELRAIGTDRGYNIPPGGARNVRRKFSQAQAKDDTLGSSDTSEEPVRSSPDNTDSQEANKQKADSGYEGEYKTKFASPTAEDEARKAGMSDSRFEGWTPEKDSGFSADEVREIRDAKSEK